MMIRVFSGRHRASAGRARERIIAGAGRGVSRRATLLVGWTLAVLAMVAFASLGRGLGRMHGSRRSGRGAGGARPPRDARPLSVAGDDASGYDWAAGQGRFATGPAVLLDNQLRGGRAGVRAYRVFDPDGAAPLLVELGWLPLPGDRTLPAIEHPVDVRRVEGLLAPPPSHGIGRVAVSVQADGTLLATGLDIERLREALREPRLSPRVLKLDPALPLGHERDLDILPNTLPPGKHLGYAVQWFGLALAVLAALILSFRKSRR